jgi:polar amino acid transport system permease protein
MIALLREWHGVLLQGLINTLLLFGASAVVTVVFSLAVGTALTARQAVVRGAARVYVEFFRGSPAYVQLFWLFYALPLVGVQISLWSAAIWGLGLNHAAYAAESVRGVLGGLQAGQRDAAIALNLTALQRLRHVLLPQAWVGLVPLYANEFILLLKGTAVASLVTLPELTGAARAIVARTFEPLPAFGMVLAIYLLLALAITQLMKRLERSAGRWRDPAAGRRA